MQELEKNRNLTLRKLADMEQLGEQIFKSRA